MPSLLHEALLRLVRRDPAELRKWASEALGSVWAEGDNARIVDSQMVAVAPIERRADLVLELPNLTVVVEVQLRVDNAKLAAWPV